MIYDIIIIRREFLYQIVCHVHLKTHAQNTINITTSHLVSASAMMLVALLMVILLVLPLLTTTLVPAINFLTARWGTRYL